jgi:hypothetical protein
LWAATLGKPDRISVFSNAHVHDENRDVAFKAADADAYQIALRELC